MRRTDLVYDRTDVDFLDCPECGSEHCVTPLSASLVGEIPAEKEETIDKLREWDEEVLNG